jgi:hypothetical protein
MAFNDKNSKLHPSRPCKRLNNNTSSNFISLDFIKLFKKDGDMFYALYT